jgi:uncharacterized membrane protein HdeD (DUF308 family)
MTQTASTALAPSSQSLRSFYVLRAVIAFAWVASAAVAGTHNPVAGALFLGAYAAWDAVANLIDGQRSGGLGRNPVQLINTLVSVAAAIGMAAGATAGLKLSVSVFGAWALIAGLLQLAVGLRRRGAAKGQLFMILSGAQSALAGGFFLKMGLSGAGDLSKLIPYAAFGGFYFLLAAVALSLGAKRAAAAAA